MNEPCAHKTVAASPVVNERLMSQTLGGWLRAERVARGLSVAEMGRRLHRAAKAAGDNTVPSVAILTSYVRRWKKDKVGLTERYQFPYCVVLGISLDEFGPGCGPLPAREAAPPAPNGGVPVTGIPVVGVGDASCVVVVVPHGQQIVIELSGVSTSRVAGDSDVPRRLVVVKDPGGTAGETGRTGKGKNFRA
jgi:hypothetical protein